MAVQPMFVCAKSTSYRLGTSTRLTRTPLGLRIGDDCLRVRFFIEMVALIVWIRIQNILRGYERGSRLARREGTAFAG